MPSSCDTLVQPACATVSSLISSATSSVAGDVLSGLASAMTDGVRWTVANTASWWVTIASPDLTGEPAVTQMQTWLLPVTAAVAVAALIAAGARMVIARKANPLLDVTGGLLTIAAATTMGTVVPALLLRAGDAWSSWVLQVSTGGQFSQRLSSVLILGGNAAPAVVLIFGIVAIILSLVQAALMLFRQAALIILAGVLPLAAAGSMTPMTRPWIRKVTAWMLALICYKPAAAAVYAAAFTMIGSGSSPKVVLMGFVMLVLSVIALPVLMKFFTWTTGAVAGSGGGGQLLGAAAMGAIAVGTMRSSPSGSAQDHAAYLSTRLGNPPSGPPPGASDTPPGPPSQPAGPSGSAASGSTIPTPGATASGAAAGTASGAMTAAGPIGTATGAAAQAAAAARNAADATQPEDSR
jgi:hypothetical protein